PGGSCPHAKTMIAGREYTQESVCLSSSSLLRHSAEYVRRNFDRCAMTNPGEAHGVRDVPPGSGRIESLARRRFEGPIRPLSVFVEIDIQLTLPLQERGPLGRVVPRERLRRR